MDSIIDVLKRSSFSQCLYTTTSNSLPLMVNLNRDCVLPVAYKQIIVLLHSMVLCTIMVYFCIFSEQVVCFRRVDISMIRYALQNDNSPPSVIHLFLHYLLHRARADTPPVLSTGREHPQVPSKQQCWELIHTV